jgi:hypothetical protein
MPVIKIRRGTTEQWAASNRVLQLAELGLDTTLNKLKAGNGSTAWSSLPFLQADVDITELSQDAVATALANGTHSNITVTYDDSANTISLATGADVVTTTSLSNTLTDPSSGYISIGDLGQADGVASLDSDGKIPDSEIPDTIARDSEIPSLTGYATETYVGTAISNLVDTAPETLNTLNELAAALGDDPNFATTISTSLGNKLDSSTASSTYAPIANPTFTGTVTIPSGASISGYAPIANPTFTGTVGGITKSMVGLDNVDNTSDANKPVSTATQTALDLKLSLTDPAIDYYITNSGSGSYTVNGVANGPVEFIKGKKYRIHINASGHPFWIQTVSGGYSAGNVYSTGITGNGTQVGHIIVELAQNAPDNLYYACQFHSSMAGSVLVRTDNVSFNAQSSSYTLTTSDSARLVEMSSGGTLTITDSSSFPVGFTCDVLQTGSSQVTIAGNGFTPNATPGLKLRAQWSSATLIKRALNSWVVLGDLSA